MVPFALGMLGLEELRKWFVRRTLRPNPSIGPLRDGIVIWLLICPAGAATTPVSGRAALIGLTTTISLVAKVR